MEELNAALPEGLPTGMVKEFEDSKRNALLIRHSFLDLRDNFRRVVDPPLQSSDGKGRVTVLSNPNLVCNVSYVVKVNITCHIDISMLVSLFT